MDTLTVIDTVKIVVTQSPTESISFWSTVYSITTERILPVAIAAVIASWLALRKFRTEKYWELRLVAYNDVLNALEKMLSYLDANLLDITHEKTIKDADRAKLENKWKEGREHIEKTRRVGRLLISEEAHQIIDIDKKFKEANKDVDPEDWFSLMEKDWDVLSHVINEFITLSKKDLKLNSWFRKI